MVTSRPFLAKIPASLASVSGAKPVQPEMPIFTLVCADAGAARRTKPRRRHDHLQLHLTPPVQKRRNPALPASQHGAEARSQLCKKQHVSAARPAARSRQRLPGRHRRARLLSYDAKLLRGFCPERELGLEEFGGLFRSCRRPSDRARIRASARVRAPADREWPRRWRALSFLMMSGGVPAGAISMNQPEKSKPGKVSATAGMSGAADSRWVEAVASARNAPLRRCDSRIDAENTPAWVRPAIVSCKPLLMLTDGISSNFVPARLLSACAVTPARLRGPSTDIDILPGAALSSAISSGKRLGRHVGMHHHDLMASRHERDRRKILDRIVAQILHHVGIGDERGRGREEEGVAVGRRTRRRLRADHIAGARLVLDHEALAESDRKLVGDHARHHIGTCARGLRDDEGDRPLRPVLCRSMLREQQVRSSQRATAIGRLMFALPRLRCYED